MWGEVVQLLVNQEMIIGPAPYVPEITKNRAKYWT